MSVNGASTIFSFASWVIQVLIGCRHPLMRYWHPSGAKTAARCSLPHPENEHQWRIHTFLSCKIGNQDIALIFEHLKQLLTTLIRKNIPYARKNSHSKTIDITNCQTRKSELLAVEFTILIIHYYQTSKSGAWYESIDGPAGWPADNPPKSDRLGNFRWTVPQLAVRVYQHTGRPMWQPFGSDPDLDLKSRSGTVGNATTDLFHHWR